MKTKVLKAVLTLLVFALGALVGCAPEDGIKNIRMSFETDGGTQIEAILQEEGTEITPPEDPVKNGYTFEYWCSDAELTQKYEFGVMPGQDITLYAKYKANEYTLTFEPNGGKIEGTYPEKYTFGQTLTLPVPEFDGFAFGGWYDNAELNGESITQISAETFGNQTYYAKWTPEVYEIKYELDGMVNHPDNPSTYTFGTRIVLHNAVSEDPTKGFFGWYLTPDFTGEPVTAIEDTSMGNITLYAYVKEGVYSITYELNEGKNDARNPTYYESGKETLLYPASKQHYTFVGWYSGDTLYEDSIPATQSGPLTLTAHWKAIEYTIHYDADDGVLQDAPGSYTIETEKTDLVYPFKSGYAFVEWQDAAGNAVTSYGGGTTGDISVTAVYKQAAGVAVGEDGAVYKFLPNNGYEIVIPDNAVKINDHIQGQNTAGETYAPTSLYIGPASRLEYIGNFAFNGMTSFASTTVNLPASLKYIGNYAFLNVKFDFTLPEDNSLEFIGNAAFEGTDWETKYLKPSKEAYFYFGKVLLKYKGDDTVVDDIRSDTVGIAGGAFQDCTTLTSIVIPASVRTLGDSVFKNCTSVSSIVIPSTVTMVFYNLFDGWTADQTVYLPFAEGEVYESWDHNWSAETNATFVYTKYNIIYELDNGKNPEDAKTQYTPGEEYVLPVPTKDGYKFEGWYLTEDFRGEAITAISEETTGSVTVYAKWTLVKPIEYTLTLKADGGKLDIDQIVYDVSTEETALPYPLKAEYMFQKWVDEDGVEVTFYGGGMTGNMTLTAVYLKGEGYTLNENNEITSWERTSNNRIVIADDILKICDGANNSGNVTDAETEFYIGKNSRLTYIGNNALAYMTFKNSRFDMPKTVTYIGISAFTNCNFFIDFDEDLSALEYIGGGALEGTAWWHQQLPNYTDNDVYIGKVYYMNRDQAAEVVIREGTVSIAGSAFMRTTNVTSVVIPASVKSIGDNAFGNFSGTHATGIKSIEIPETVTMVSYDIFGSWTEDQTVYLPFAEGEEPADWDQNWAGGNSKATFIYTKYNIVYELNDGTNPEGAQTQYTRGEEYVLPVPTKDGCKFEGWYLTEDFSGEAITAISEETTGSVTVYAKWTLVEPTEYTLTLEAGGGTLDIYQIVYNVSTEETALPYPLKAGHMFQKWVDEDGAEVTVYGGGMTGNKTLTAVYLEGEGYIVNGNKEITGWERTSNNRIVIADDILKIIDHPAGPAQPTDGQTEFYIGKNSRLTYIGNNALANMTFKNSRFDMPKTVTYIGISALTNCNFFIDFDEDLSALEYIGGSALEGTAWANEQLPNYKDNDVYIGKVYYMNRNQAAEVVIREGTVSIAGGAFMRTTNVTSVVIPASVKSIGDNAFGNFSGTHATGIKSIEIPETVTMVSYDIFGSWTEDQTVYLPFAEGEKPAGWDQNWAGGNSKATFVYKNDQAD